MPKWIVSLGKNLSILPEQVFPFQGVMTRIWASKTLSVCNYIIITYTTRLASTGVSTIISYFPDYNSIVNPLVHDSKPFSLHNIIPAIPQRTPEFLPKITWYGSCQWFSNLLYSGITWKVNWCTGLIARELNLIDHSIVKDKINWSTYNKLHAAVLVLTKFFIMQEKEALLSVEVRVRQAQFSLFCFVLPALLNFVTARTQALLLLCLWFLIVLSLTP